MFINGEKLEGALDADEVRAALEPAAAGRRRSAARSGQRRRSRLPPSKYEGQ